MAMSAPVARAYEDLITLDVELGYAHAVSEVVPAHGVAVGLGASLGLSDTFALRGQLAFAQHPGETRSTSVALFAGELLYLIDVFELVPYFGVGLDALGLGGSAREWGAELAAHPVLGIDWLLSRELAVGLQARPMFLLSALDEDPFYFKVGVSLSYLIDPL
jgi:hypothetical protein